MTEAGLGIHHERALQFANAMRLCRDDLSAYALAAGLLAVHSAISFGDAVLLALGGGRPRGEDHSQAVRSLRKLCRQGRIDERGIKHFENLLGAKTDISYGDAFVTIERIKLLCETAERFQTWAERTIQRHGGRQ